MAEFSIEQTGLRFRQIRSDLGYGGPQDLRRFCRDFKLNPSTWGLLEKGRKTLYLDSLAELCTLFDVSANWLLFGTGDKQLSADMGEQPIAINDLIGLIANDMTRITSWEERESKKQKLYDYVKGLIAKDAKEHTEGKIPHDASSVSTAAVAGVGNKPPRHTEVLAKTKKRKKR